MHLSVAVAKINKWSVRQGGDTLEVIERPRGGLSIVLADGQSSGPGAKSTSIAVVRKVISELADGVRDGAAVRAASDVLYAQRGGKVSATLVVISAEMDTRTLVVTRLGAPSTYVFQPESGWLALPGTDKPLGFHRHVRPAVDQFPLCPGLVVCAFTDGVLHAGSRRGLHLELPQVLADLWTPTATAQALADGLLARALALDEQRPVDDTSIAVLHVRESEGAGPRTLRIEMPLSEV